MWLGLTPRSLADRVRAAVSPPKAWALNDGTFWARAWIMSGWPVFLRTSLPRTVIGAGLSTAFMPVVRVPVTMTASSSATSGDGSGVSAE